MNINPEITGKLKELFDKTQIPDNFEYKEIYDSIIDARKEFDSDEMGATLLGMVEAGEMTEKDLLSMVSPNTSKSEAIEAIGIIGGLTFFKLPIESIEKMLSFSRSVGEDFTPSLFEERDPDEDRDEEESGARGVSRGLPGRGQSPEDLLSFWAETLLEPESVSGIEFEADSESGLKAIAALVGSVLMVDVPHDSFSSPSSDAADLATALNEMNSVLSGLEAASGKSEMEIILEDVYSHHEVIHNILTSIAGKAISSDEVFEGISDDAPGEPATPADKKKEKKEEAAREVFKGEDAIKRPKEDQALKVRLIASRSQGASGVGSQGVCGFYDGFRGSGVSGPMDAITETRDDSGAIVRVSVDLSVRSRLESSILTKIEILKNNSLNGADINAKGSFVTTEFKENRSIVIGDANDLYSAIKIWDEEVFDLHRSYRAVGSEAAEDILDLLMSPSMLKNGNKMLETSIVMITSLVFPSFALQKFRGVSKEDKKIENFETTYNEVYEVQIRRKFKEHFMRNRAHKYGKLFLTHSMYRSISKSFIRMITIAKLNTKEYTGWNGIECPMCNKWIRFSKYTRNMSGKESAVDLQKTSDFRIQNYSPISSSGKILNREFMLDPEGLGSVIRYEYSKKPDEPKNWDEIEELIRSRKKEDHVEGMLRRQEALGSIRGSKKIQTAGVEVSTVRFKCPFACDKAGGCAGDGKPDVVSQCGLSLSSELLKRKDPEVRIRPEHLQPVPAAAGPGFIEELNEAVRSGAVSEDEREVFERYFEKVRSGGWKFSRVFFACPCHIEIEEQVVSSNIPRDIRNKYRYLAIPHYGPIDAMTGESTDYAAPTTADGRVSAIEPGRAGYLVCGSATSLSSFDRDPNSSNSMSSFLSRVVSDDKGEATRGVLNLLVRFGIDAGDLEPFILELKNASAGFDDNRIRKIAELLSLAMGVKLDSTHGAGIHKYSAIKDLGLVCKNGHKFTIGQSIGFGSAHAGYDLGKKGSMSWESIEKDRLLTSRGKNSTARFVEAGILVEDSNDLDRKSYSSWKESPLGLRRDYDFIMPSKGAASQPARYHFNSDIGSRLRYIWSPTSSVFESFDPGEVKLGDPTKASSGTNMVQDDGVSSSGEATGVTESDKMQHQNYKEEQNKRAFESRDLPGLYIRQVGDMITAQLKNIITWKNVGTSLDVAGVLRSENDPCCSDEQMSRIREELMGILADHGVEKDDDKIVEMANKAAEPLISKFEGKDPDLLRSLSQYSKEEVQGVIEEGVSSALSLYGHGAAGTILIGSDYVSSIYQILIPALTMEESTLSEDLTLRPNEKVPRGYKKKMGRRRSELTGRLVMLATALRLSDLLARISKIYLNKDLSPARYIGYNLGVDLSSSDAIMQLSFEDLSGITKSERDALATTGSDEESSPWSLDTPGGIRTWKESMEDLSGELSATISGLRAASLSHSYLERARGFLESQLSGNGDDAADIIRHIYGDISVVDISLHREDKYARVTGSNPERYVPTYSAKIARFSEDIALKDSKFGKSAGYYVRGIMHILSTAADPGDAYGFGIPSPDAQGIAYILAQGIIKEGRVLHPPYGNPRDDLTEKLPQEVIENGWSVFAVPDTTTSPKYSFEKTMEHISVAYHPYTKILKKDGDVPGLISNDMIGYSSTGGIPFGRITYPDFSAKTPFPRRDLYNGHVGVVVPMAFSPSITDAGTVTRPQSSLKPEVTSIRPAYPTRVPVIDIRLPVEISSGGRKMTKDLSWAMQRSPAEASLIMSKIDKSYSRMRRHIEGVDALHTAHMRGDENAATKAAKKLKSLALIDESSFSKMIDESLYPELRAAIKKHYIGIISSLHDEYRSLPFRTISSLTMTAKKEHSVTPDENGIMRETISEALMGSESREGSRVVDRYHPVSMQYIPMVDWVTANHMIMNEQYGPRFGGHGMWGSGDNDAYRASVQANFKNALVNMYGLEVMASDINLAIRKKKIEGITIDTEDILNGRGIVGKLGHDGVKKVLKYDSEEWTSEVGNSTLFWDSPDMSKFEASKDVSSSTFETKDRQAMMKSHIGAIKRGTFYKKAENWSRYAGGIYEINGSTDRSIMITPEESGGIKTSVLSPGAYIRIMADIKPDDPEALDGIRSYDSDEILDIAKLNSMKIMYSRDSDKPFGRDDAHGIFNFTNRLWENLTGDMNSMLERHANEVGALFGEEEIRKKSSTEKMVKIAKRKLSLERIIMIARAEDLLGQLIK